MTRAEVPGVSSAVPTLMSRTWAAVRVPAAEVLAFTFPARVPAVTPEAAWLWPAADVGRRPLPG